MKSAKLAHLHKQTQIRILAFRRRPTHFAIILVADVFALQDMNFEEYANDEITIFCFGKFHATHKLTTFVRISLKMVK